MRENEITQLEDKLVIDAEEEETLKKSIV